MISIFVVGVLIDRHLRRIIVATTILFAAATLALALLSGVPVVVYLAAAGWGVDFGSSATLFTTAVVNVAGEAGDVAQSVMISVFSGSIAAGGLVGGVLLAFGSDSLVGVCLLLVAFAAIVATLARRHAFPPDRSSE